MMAIRLTCSACLLTVLVSLATTACTAGGDSRDASGDGATVRDSAGITIVENPVRANGSVPTWAVDPTPSVTIGDTTGDPAYQFTSIGAVQQLPNGMIVILDGQGESKFLLRFYDSTGKHIATHGRLGQGPGDHRWINFFGSVGGDTIVGVDFPNSRMSWVSASRGFLRSSRLDESGFRKLVGENASGMVETMVPLGDSVYAVKAFRSSTNVRNPFERETSYHLVDLARDTAFDVARYASAPSKLIHVGGRDQHVRARDAGDPVHVVDRERGRICAGITTTAELSCVDKEGRRRIIRWKAEVAPYTDADNREFEETYRSRMRPNSRLSSADIEAMLGAMGRPQTHPVFTMLQLDTPGNFWLREYMLDESNQRQSRFRVLDPDGRHIAFADSFPALRVGFGYGLQITDRAVLRVVRDADDVQTVAAFRIRKPGRSD